MCSWAGEVHLNEHRYTLMHHRLVFGFQAVIVTALWIMKSVEEFFLSTNFDVDRLFQLKLKGKSISHQKHVFVYSLDIIFSLSNHLQIPLDLSLF